VDRLRAAEPGRDALAVRGSCGARAADVHREAHGLVADEIYQVQEGS
jgi:hypothetical protein